jgi:hypothetical protein
VSLTFADESTAVIPDTPADLTPEVNDVEYPCQVCGKEAGPYGGRGRKPTKCPEHKKTATSGVRAPRITGNNATLAAQATEALCSIDGIMALGARIVGFTDTAETIEEADETFRLRVHAALLNSPDTSRKILRYGSKAGDAGLFIAIGLHIATIAPVFLTEAKIKKAEREAKRSAEEELVNNAARAGNS